MLPKRTLLFSLFALTALADWTAMDALSHHKKHKHEHHEGLFLPAGGGSGETEEELAAEEEATRAAVVKLKRAHTVMEEDPAALVATGQLQEATRKLLLKRYGQFVTQGGPDGARGKVFRIKMQVLFPPNQDDVGELGSTGTIVVESAPIELMPHAVQTFLEVRGGGAVCGVGKRVVCGLVDDRIAMSRVWCAHRWCGSGRAAPSTATPATCCRFRRRAARARGSPSRNILRSIRTWRARWASPGGRAGRRSTSRRWTTRATTGRPRRCLPVHSFYHYNSS